MKFNHRELYCYRPEPVDKIAFETIRRLLKDSADSVTLEELLIQDLSLPENCLSGTIQIKSKTEVIFYNVVRINKFLAVSLVDVFIKGWKTFDNEGFNTIILSKYKI